MTPPLTAEPDAVLNVPGTAADHLYREGSAKASFWETVFGSSLSAKRRPHVSTLASGTRMFDIPLQSVEHELLRNAEVWMKSGDAHEMCREALELVTSKEVQVRLIGLQPQGHAVAEFGLRFEMKEPSTVVDPAVPGAFRSWFGAEGPRIAEETLIPFGFTPHTP